MSQPELLPAEPPPRGRRRTLLLAAGVAVVAAAVGGGYWWLERAPEPQAGPQLRTGARPGFTSPTATPLRPLFTPAATGGLNARNPFLGRITTTTTTTTTGPEETTGTTGTGTQTTTGTQTGTQTVTQTGTQTGTATTTTGGPGPVYVTVLSVGTKKPAYTAVFLVNGVRFTQDAGSTFGVPVTFSYDSTTVLEGTRCARFAYGDEQHTLCPGEQINVA